MLTKRLRPLTKPCIPNENALTPRPRVRRPFYLHPRPAIRVEIVLVFQTSKYRILIEAGRSKEKGKHSRRENKQERMEVWKEERKEGGRKQASSRKEGASSSRHIKKFVF